MGTKPPLLSRNRWIWRRVILSIWAAFVGWLSFVVVVFLCFLVVSISNPLGAFCLALIFGTFAGMGVLPVWLFLLVPLSLVIPDTSVWWKPPHLILSGIVAGPLVVLIYSLGRLALVYGSVAVGAVPADAQMAGGGGDWKDFLSTELVFGLPAAFIGGVTCGMGARLHGKIVEKENAELLNQTAP